MLVFCLSYNAISNLYDYLMNGSFPNLAIWAADEAVKMKREDMLFNTWVFLQNILIFITVSHGLINSPSSYRLHFLFTIDNLSCTANSTRVRTLTEEILFICSYKQTISSLTTYPSSQYKCETENKKVCIHVFFMTIRI